MLNTDAAERLFNEIQSLDDHGRNYLFYLLEDAYEFVLSDDREKFGRPWRDPRDGFSKKQIQLLDWLDSAQGEVENRETILALWRPRRAARADPEKWEAKLMARLRQLKVSTNDRLLRLKYRWKVGRSRNGYLRLFFR
jgi:hypothetical protein